MRDATVATWIETAERVAGILAGVLPHAEATAEAWRFVSGVTGRPVASLIPRQARQPVPADDLAVLDSAVSRLQAGEPEAYVIGRVPFHDVDVAVDPRALIPRPETELLVDVVIQWCARERRVAPRILDVGTGTGCIALAVARAWPSAHVTATDICRRALDLAAQNLRSSPWGRRVRLVCADWLEWTTSSWDVIVGNPPYIAGPAIAALPASVRGWEPRLALDGGFQGRTHIDALIGQARSRLMRGGLLALELSPEHAAAATARALRYGYAGVSIVEDYAGRARILVATVGGTACGA